MGYYNLERRELLNFIPGEPKLVLDIGCGEGLFGKMLKSKYACTVVGVEPDKDSCILANKNIDRCLNGEFERLKDELIEKFDLIFFNDVLEHMVDPWSTLRLVKANLNHDGKIIASLPNILHFYAMKDIILNKDWKYEDKGIMDKTHLRFFTKKSIERLFKECGYNIERIEGINPVVSRGVSLINMITLGRYNEIRYPQFVVVASPT